MGSHVERYELHEELGRGGFGVVYRATHRAMKREVALKVQRAGTDHTRFLQEAQLLARLQHRNIVQVYDCGDWGDGQVFLALELVSGCTLTDLIKVRALPPTQCAWVVRELLSALIAAHAAGVVHRDIKPSNTLLGAGSGSAHLYLLDFGVARDVAGPRLTATGVVIGTTRYIAPEMLRGEAASPASDLWALGILAVECWTGEPAYAGLADQLIPAILSGPPAGLRAMEGTPLGAFVAKLLAPAEARFKSAADALRALQAIPVEPIPLRRLGRQTFFGTMEVQSAEVSELERRSSLEMRAVSLPAVSMQSLGAPTAATVSPATATGDATEPPSAAGTQTASPTKTAETSTARRWVAAVLAGAVLGVVATLGAAFVLLNEKAGEPAVELATSIESAAPSGETRPNWIPVNAVQPFDEPSELLAPVATDAMPTGVEPPSSEAEATDGPRASASMMSRPSRMRGGPRSAPSSSRSRAEQAPDESERRAVPVRSSSAGRATCVDGSRSVNPSTVAGWARLIERAARGIRYSTSFSASVQPPNVLHAPPEVLRAMYGWPRFTVPSTLSCRFVAPRNP